MLPSTSRTERTCAGQFERRKLSQILIWHWVKHVSSALPEFERTVLLLDLHSLLNLETFLKFGILVTVDLVFFSGWWTSCWRLTGRRRLASRPTPNRRLLPWITSNRSIKPVKSMAYQQLPLSRYNRADWVFCSGWYPRFLSLWAHDCDQIWFISHHCTFLLSITSSCAHLSRKISVACATRTQVFNKALCLSFTPDSQLLESLRVFLCY